MSILIRIPSPLRGFTNGLKTVEAEGKTVSEDQYLSQQRGYSDPQ
jgi:hypothetical protein